jgi:CubicO group peptidase (beta-lactamase class C family)
MASISKPFVAMAILQLVDAGKIKLDAPLTYYIPYFKMSDNRFKQVTIRQMLMHTSGIPDVRDYHWGRSKFDNQSRENYIRDSISKEKLLFTPGEQFSYSDMAYDALAEVITLVSKVKFEEYMKKKIFLPCGMKYTTFLSPETYPTLRTNGHILGKNGRINVSPTYPYNMVHSGSSTLLSNADEMMLWIQMLLKKGWVNGHRIISDSSYKLMTSVQHKFDDHSGIALGLFIDDQDGTSVLSHSGSDVGYTAYMAISPKDSTGIVCISNLWRYAPVDEMAFLGLNIINHQPIWKLKKSIALVIAPTLHDQGLIKAKQLSKITAHAS